MALHLVALAVLAQVALVVVLELELVVLQVLVVLAEVGVLMCVPIACSWNMMELFDVSLVLNVSKRFEPRSN